MEPLKCVTLPCTWFNTYSTLRHIHMIKEDHLYVLLNNRHTLKYSDLDLFLAALDSYQIFWLTKLNCEFIAHQSRPNLQHAHLPRATPKKSQKKGRWGRGRGSSWGDPFVPPPPTTTTFIQNLGVRWMKGWAVVANMEWINYIQSRRGSKIRVPTPKD